MKTIKLLFCISFLAFGISWSSAQSWVWAKQGNIIDKRYIGNFSEGFSVATDVSGNAYLAGYYLGDTLIFSPDSLFDLLGDMQTFLVKYSPTGNVLWAKQSISPSLASYGLGYSVATDSHENSYITGVFVDTISFDSYSLTGNVECFLTKYNPNGKVLWAKQSTSHSEGQVYGESVSTDKNSNIYVVGNFDDTAAFGSFQLNEPLNLTSAFAAKYDSNGNVLWATQAVIHSINGYASGLGVALDKKGNVYMTGYFADTVYFGAYRLSSNYVDYLVLVKYNAAGNTRWAKQAGISTLEIGLGSKGYAVATDKLSNVYVTGYFQDTLKIGSKKIFSNEQDLFVAKFDSNGNNIWVQSAIVLDSNRWAGYAISIDTNENLYVSAGGVGSLHGNYKIALGKDTFKTYVAGPDGASLVIKMDTSGKFLCASIVSGGGDDNNGIAVDPSGQNVYFGGDIVGTITFGQTTLIAPPYNESPFMTKWSADCGNNTSDVSLVTPLTSSVSIYPNPSNGVFTIGIRDKDQGISGTQIEVYNMLGAEVLTETLRSTQGDKSINLSNQPNGIYLYRVTTETGNLIGQGKLILQR